MKATGDYFITVIEDTRSNSIIGSATLVIEHKFIHECATVRKNILNQLIGFKFLIKNYLINFSAVVWKMS